METGKTARLNEMGVFYHQISKEHKTETSLIPWLDISSFIFIEMKFYSGSGRDSDEMKSSIELS